MRCKQLFAKECQGIMHRKDGRPQPALWQQPPVFSQIAINNEQLAMNN
jgi:hypothetical protein